MRKIEIQEVENGYTMKTYVWEKNDRNDEAIYTPLITVFECNDDTNKTIIKLLEAISEELGYPYNKYGTENINIKFNKKGNKL